MVSDTVTTLNEKELLEKYLPNGFFYENKLFGPITTPEILDRTKNFNFRPTDIIISSYPKSGTTWVSEILSWIVYLNSPDICTNIDLADRVQFLETKNLKTGSSTPDDLNRIPNSIRRLIKTHLPPSFFTSNLFDVKPKIIHVYRNPFDTAVSFYHFYKNIEGLGFYKGTWDEFFEMFKNGYVVYGDWFNYMSDWWSKRYLDNILYIEYESLKQNPHYEVKRIAEFIRSDEKIISDENIEYIVSKCSFLNMKNNPRIYSFLCRKGVVGDWKNYFNEEQKEYILNQLNNMIVTNGLKICYEI